MLRPATSIVMVSPTASSGRSIVADTIGIPIASRSRYALTSKIPINNLAEIYVSDSNDWNANLGGAFGKAVPEDEYYHGWGPPGDALTETWYWGFNIPDAAINCFIYCWVHPNLDVVSTGLIIYQGIKRHHLAAELFDMPAYLKAGPVVGNGSRIVVPNGLTVEVAEPLREMRLSYADAGRDTNCDIRLVAVDAPIMRANNLHFEQVMRATGTLRLRGIDYAVDCFTVRDRSWGELRPESHNPVPPYNWVTGVFDEGKLAFNIGSHDDPAGDPEWTGKMIVDPAKIFKDGWVVRDGNQIRVVDAAKRVWRDSQALRPERFEIDLHEEGGRWSRIDGTVIASVPGFHWPNIATHLALVQWEMDGMIGYGESQDVQWNDYVYKCGQMSGGEM